MAKEKLYIAQTFFGRFDESTRRFSLDTEVVVNLLNSILKDEDVEDDVTELSDKRWVLSSAARECLHDNKEFRTEVEEFLGGGRDSLSLCAEEASVGLGRTKDQANDAYLQARNNDQADWEDDD